MGNTASDHAKTMGTDNGQTTNTIARGGGGGAIASGGHPYHHYDDTLGILMGEGQGGGGEARYARSTTKFPMTKEELQSLQIEIHDDVRRIANTVEDVRMLFFFSILLLAVVAIAALVWYYCGRSRRGCEGWRWWKRERTSHNLAALDRTRQQALAPMGGNSPNSNENTVNSSGGGSGGNSNRSSRVLGATPPRENHVFPPMDLHEMP